MLNFFKHLLGTPSKVKDASDIPKPYTEGDFEKLWYGHFYGQYSQNEPLQLASILAGL